MRAFTVEKEIVRGSGRCAVASDGTPLGEYQDFDPTLEITTGFEVSVYSEAGVAEPVFYPVATNMETGENNEAEVLARIKADFPPEEYQNNEW